MEGSNGVNLRRLALDIDGADILTAAGIAGIAVWVADAYGWTAAIGVTGACLLILGLGSVLMAAMLTGRR